MIVEDEHGNDIDLHDLHAQEREPDYEPEQEEPLDLDELQDAYSTWAAGLNLRGGQEALRASAGPYTEASAVLRRTFPGLLAELRDLRSRLEGLHANRVIQYVLTDGPEPGTGTTEMATREQIDEAFARPELGKTPWIRNLYAESWSWTPLSNEPPF